METYTPGMGSAISVGQLPVEKTAYDTKNRMMQMDMMGMKAKAMADAALKAKKAQEDKDLLTLKAGDADYFQEIYNNQDINPSIKKLLTLKQQGMLTEANKLAVTGDLESKAKQYQVLAKETREAVANAMKGMENVYDPGVLLDYVKQKQYQRFLAKDATGKLDPKQYLQTDIQADVDDAKKQLKTLQQSNINSAFVKTANERKNKVQVAKDPSGLYKTGSSAEAQAYWQLNPKTGKITGFDFDGFYGDYTTPGTPTQQLYVANREEKLKDPNFKKDYDDAVAKLQTKYASDPAKLQSAMNKINAEEFIFPYFGQGKRWEDFFAKSEGTEAIRQYVAPTREQMEKEDAEYAGTPQVEIITSPAHNNAQSGKETTVSAQMTREQAANLKPDIRTAYTMDQYGRLSPIGKDVQNISQGADQSYKIVARTSLNPSGIIVYDKSGKRVDVNQAFPNLGKNFKNAYFSRNGSFGTGGELNIRSTEEFIKYANSKGYTTKVKSRGGEEVAISGVKDLASVPGSFVTSAYFKVDLPTGQEKPVGPAPKETRNIDPKSGNMTTTQGATTINIGSPGLPASIYYPAKAGSSIKTIAQRNMGQEKVRKLIEDAEKVQNNATLNSLGGAMQPAQGGSNQVEEFEFE